MNRANDSGLHEMLKEHSVFLATFATEMLAAGATTIQIERNLHKMARAWQTHAEFSLLPSHIILNLWDEERTQSYNTIDRVQEAGIDLAKVTRLCHIANDVESRHYTLADAQRLLKKAQEAPRAKQWIVTLLVGCANASFCRLFGGDWGAMAVVWFATIDGFFLKIKLTEQRWDYRAVIIVSACVAAILSCLAHIDGVSATPDIALATSVLFLVPGIPFGNAVNDLIYGHYLCSISRLTKATVITVCLSLGLCVALFLTNMTM